MKLTDIDLKGLGRFLRNPASFEITKFFLPEPWDYIYTNRKILLRIRHNGTGYAQLDPPGGTVLHKMERFQDFPSFFVWVKPEGKDAFSNFFKPNFDVRNPSRQPGRYACTFTPAKAVFHLRHAGIDVLTEMTVPAADPAVIMRVTVRNAARRRRVDVFPVWRPHNTFSALAPWDVPEVYQTCQYCNDPHQVVWIETRNPGGIARLRRRAVVMTDLEVDDAEVYFERFTGHGNFALPQAVLDGKLAIDASKKYRYLEKDLVNTALSQLPVAAFHKAATLDKGEAISFTVILAGLPEQADGSMPPYAEIARYETYLCGGAFDRVAAENDAAYRDYQSLRSVQTPDEAFNRYVNEWLPLQLRWVTMLDRGWPTGLRGTRDAAQDFTGLIPFYPAEARRVLLDVFACQRSDGWFPRQYSTDGPDGKHDLRPYVDAGCWVWEFLYDYIRFTLDMSVLDEKVRWLDDKQVSCVLDHAKAIFAYYMNPENIGEHGFVKIREGDWLDSINAAGVLGRGESVMVSCQMVLACRQAAGLFARLGLDVSRYAGFGGRIRESIRKHALNSQGYLNGLFNDAGRWICSPKDPDGRRRINSPVNSFGVIAGIFEESELPRLFDEMKTLKQDNGYTLFKPGIGDIPIGNLGRIGQGDMLPGVGENGNPYNHGSHGFFGRAAAVAGQGDLLQDIFKYMLPYDQQAHPVEISQTAPYAVVNHWASIEGQFGRGGATFLSGSITTAIRNVYGGMMGFQPTLDGVAINPCIPSNWRRLRYRHSFRQTQFDVTIENANGVQAGVESIELNGRRITGNNIPASDINKGTVNKVRVVMG